MAKVNQTLEAPLGGVSRRPQERRLSSQAEEQQNMLALFGDTRLTRRPPLEHIAKILTDTTGYETAFFKEIRRSADEKYILVIINEELKVFDAETGDEITVNTPDGTDYLAGEVRASLTTALSGANNDLTFTSRIYGTFGNTITVTYSDAIVLLDHPLEVTVGSGKDIIVSFQEVGAAIVYPTALQIQAVIQAHAGANALVEVTLPTGSTGAGAAIALAQTALSGASDNVNGFRAVTIRDRTVIVNRDRTTRRGTEKSPTTDKEALLYVRQGDYDTNYTVTLNGATVTYTTPTSGRADIATDVIAADILAALTGNVGINNNFTITRFGSTLHVVNKVSPTIDFTISANDGLGDLAFLAIKGSVQRFTDLPAKAKPGFAVEVKGDDSTEFDNFFVQYEEGDTPEEAGTWKEIAQPESIIQFDKATMPHVLEYQGGYLSEDTENGPALSAPWFREGAGNHQIIELDSDATYPPGASVSVTLDGTTFSYQNATSAYATAITMRAGLENLINAHASWICTPMTDYEFEVEKTPDAAFVGTATTIYDRTTRFASPDLAMTASEHVGRTIKNLTDGSTATVLSNTVVSVVSTALTGGADNQFDPEDLVNIVGTDVYFTFRESPWRERAAGTLETVPFPSFTDDVLSGVFEHQGRLGFISGPNVVLSQAGEKNHFNFFRQTATQLLADDVIDNTSSMGESPKFDSTRNWNGALLLKSDKGQYEMRGDRVFSPTTVSLTQIGEYQTVPNLPIVILGSSAFFIGSRSQLPLLWDFRVRAQEEKPTAEDLTQFIPGYIKGTPLQIEADDAHGLLYLRTDNDRNSLFVFATQYMGPQRAQAAWSRWEVSPESEVVSVLASTGQVFIITKDADGVYLNVAYIAQENNPAAREDGVGHVFLDRVVTQDTDGVTTSYVNGVTTWTLPYSVSSLVGDVRVVRVTADGGIEKLLTYRPGPNDRVAYIGDASADDVFIGVAYESRYRVSRIYRRNENDLPDVRGKLTLSWLTVRFEDTMDFAIAMADARGPWYLDGAHPLDGSVRLMPSRELAGEEDEETDFEQRFHIGADSAHVALEILTSEPGPMNISSISWEGEQHDRRGTR